MKLRAFRRVKTSGDPDLGADRIHGLFVLSAANQRWLEYRGLSLEEGLGGSWKAAIHPDDLSIFLDAWLASVASTEPFDGT
jgi:hypothetical protein